MTRRQKEVAGLVLTFLIGVLTNVATGSLPKEWEPYLWLSWVPLGVCILVVLALKFVPERGASDRVGDHRGLHTDGGPAILGSQVPQANIVTGGTFPPLTPQQYRNRSRMLDRVETFWVKGVLEQSLYEIARIELGLEYDPNVLAHPWESIIQRPNQQSEPVPSGKPIIDVFDELGGELLILGAPGAGKTTLLLELARDLIARARQNNQHPLPIVFNLSRWAAKRQALDTWLAEELNQQYDIPKQLSEEWIVVNTVLPLLDGLDEVVEGHREECVQTINTYRRQQGFVPLAVCSRGEEYTMLPEKLRLEGAIIIQPLTRQTVEAYLRQVGRPFATVRRALRADQTLWDFVNSPLMLSILVLTYKDKISAKLQVEQPTERRKQLFDDYVAAMFARPGRSTAITSYTPSQTIHWLSWLARQMVANNLTSYYIEQMQPDWMPFDQQHRYRKNARRIIVLVSTLVSVWGVSVSSWWLPHDLLEIFDNLQFMIGLDVEILVLLFGALGGVVVGLLIDVIIFSEFKKFRRVEMVEALRWTWSRNVLLTGFGRGLFLGLVSGVLVAGVSLLSDVVWWMLYRQYDADLTRFQILALRIGSALHRLLSIESIKSATVLWLIVTLLSGLFLALLSGLSGAELIVKETPNQGIRRSIRSSLIGIAIVGAFGAVLGGVFGAMLAGISGTVSGGLVVGLFGSLIGGMYYGGLSVLGHYTLRYLFYHTGALPFHLVPFLDYAAERILLRKVGGGYIFVHRLLMEYFASLSIE